MNQPEPVAATAAQGGLAPAELDNTLGELTGATTNEAASRRRDAGPGFDAFGKVQLKNRQSRNPGMGDPLRTPVRTAVRKAVPSALTTNAGGG